MSGEPRLVIVEMEDGSRQTSQESSQDLQVGEDEEIFHVKEVIENIIQNVIELEKLENVVENENRANFTQGQVIEEERKEAQRPTSCKAKCHEEAQRLFPNSSREVMKTNNTRTFRGEFRSFVQRNSIVDWKKGRGSLICGSCVEFIHAQLPAVPVSNTTGPSNSKPDVIEIVRSIDAGEFSNAEICQLAAAIGRNSSKELDMLSKKYSSVNRNATMLSYSYENEWFTNPCEVFKAFAEAYCSIWSVPFEYRKSSFRHLEKASESLCMIKKPRLISPLALAENIVLHSYTGSRAACTMYSRSQSSGSYSMLSTTIQDISAEKPSFPKGDIFVAFDNQQVIGKEFRVTAGGNQKISIVTTVCVFKEQDDLQIQSNYSLSTSLVRSPSNIESLWKLHITASTAHNALHRQYRSAFINSRLKLNQEAFNKDQLTLEEKEVFQTIEYEKGLEYTRVPQSSSALNVYDMESLMINPNSTKTVTNVLDYLLEMNEASDPTRKWISVYCDGLPFGIAVKLIESVYICNVCKESGPVNDLRLHQCTGQIITRKYEKILLRPGFGHVEINLVRAIFNSFFNILIEPIAKMLNFNTPKALQFCKAASDHHKSWQILQIIYLSLTDEIIHLFLTTRPTSNEATEEDFGIWKLGQKPNVLLACDIVFNILHPLFLFRAGVRQCNEDVVSAALYKISGLFFGFNHPKYREIITRDHFFLLSMPRFGSLLAKRNAFRFKGSAKGQGLDFLLEEQNRKQKSWTVSRGPPTEKQWKRASSSLSVFELIKKNVLNNLEISDDDVKSHHIDFGQEYLEARIHFRNVLTLCPDHLTTFSNTPTAISPSFANCIHMCNENREKYFRAFLQQEKPILNIVEASDLMDLDISDIRKKSKSKLKQLASHPELKHHYSDILDKCNTKDDLVEFYGDLQETIMDINYRFDFEL